MRVVSSHTLISLLSLSRPPARVPRCAMGGDEGVPFGPISVPAALSERLRASGIVAPVPIQREAMCLITDGESVVIHAETGSGKTLAFLVPLLAALEREPPSEGGVGLLVVAPSQELAVQLAAEAERLHVDTRPGRPAGAPAVLLAISSSREAELEQQAALYRSLPPAVVVGTPQRLVDLCRHPSARTLLRGLRAIVLDEVDLMVPPLPADAAGPKATAGGAPWAKAAGGGRGNERGRGGRGRGGGGAEYGRSGSRAAYGQADRAGRGGGRGGRGGRGGGSVPYYASIERRLAAKKPAELLVELVLRNRARSAPPLQLVSSSATINADLRRQLGALLGGEGKKAAGTVVTCDAAHPAPKALRKFGVGGVSLPSTIRHSAYIGKPKAMGQMLQLAFEELTPAAPLLVIPNGHSVPKRVSYLRELGFTNAAGLQDALGVPRAAESDGAAEGEGEGGSTGLQGGMVERREALAAAFGAKPTAGSEREVPLLVTSEHSARGIDLKGIDVVFMVGLPSRTESYVHVVGRTAREGRKGRAVTLITEVDEAERLGGFSKELGIKIESIDVRFLTGR